MRNYYIFVLIFLSLNLTFAQRSAEHTLTIFNVNSSINEFSFDIYSKNTGTNSIRVGFTDYYIDFNTSALSNPLLSNVNPKYSSGSSTGDYNPMSVQIISRKVAVAINYSGTGDGTGELLSTVEPIGERICTVTLTISDQNALANIQWDTVNSSMQTTSLAFTVDNTYSGSFNNPLPVELSNFSASAKKNIVNLKWETATEVNNYGFDIERSKDEKLFEKVGFVKGHGNSNSPKSYVYSDKANVFSSKVYYRLKQIDLDGSYTYSNVINVSLQNPESYELFQNFPNPFNPVTRISFQLPTRSNVAVKVFNIIGEQVAELLNEVKDPGFYEVNFDGSNLPSGLYIYTLNADGLNFIKKMMLVK